MLIFVHVYDCMGILLPPTNNELLCDFVSL